MRVVFPSSGSKASPPFQLGSVIHTTRGAWRISIGLLRRISHCAAENCRLSITEPVGARGREEDRAFPAMCGATCMRDFMRWQRTGEWSSCHQIPADAPTVIHWRLSCREKTFIRSSQSETLGLLFFLFCLFVFFIISEKDQWSGVGFFMSSTTMG